MIDNRKKGKVPIKTMILLMLAALAIHAVFFSLFDYDSEVSAPDGDDRNTVYLLDLHDADEAEALPKFIAQYDPAAVFSLGSGIGFDSFWQTPKWRLPPEQVINRTELPPENDSVAAQVEIALPEELALANSWLPEVASPREIPTATTPERSYPEFLLDDKIREFKLPERETALPFATNPTTGVIFRREAGFWRYQVTESSGSEELDDLLIFLARRDILPAIAESDEFVMRAQWRALAGENNVDAATADNASGETENAKATP